MPAAFKDVFSCAGVDQDVKPWPMMMVPGDGTNVVRLIDGVGLQLVPPAGFTVKELRWEAARMLAYDLPGDIVSVLMGSLRPGAILNSRYFRVHSRRLVGPTPVQIKAIRPGISKVVAALDVVVLRKKWVNIAIRPVQVRAPQGGIVDHSKQPYDFKAMIAQMNAIWTPQANVGFKLVSSSPVQIIDEVEIAKILELSTSSGAAVPSMVVLQRFTSVFERLKEKDADLTMFLVQSAGDLADPGARYSNATQVSGVTDSRLRISLISDDRTRYPEVMAHGAGHYLGAHGNPDGSWVRFGDTAGVGLLMNGSGSDLPRIPLREVVSYFNPP